MKLITLLLTSAALVAINCFCFAQGKSAVNKNDKNNVASLLVLAQQKDSLFAKIPTVDNCGISLTASIGESHGTGVFYQNIHERMDKENKNTGIIDSSKTQKEAIEGNISVRYGFAQNWSVNATVGYSRCALGAGTFITPIVGNNRYVLPLAKTIYFEQRSGELSVQYHWSCRDIYQPPTQFFVGAGVRYNFNTFSTKIFVEKRDSIGSILEFDAPYKKEVITPDVYAGLAFMVSNSLNIELTTGYSSNFYCGLAVVMPILNATVQKRMLYLSRVKIYNKKEQEWENMDRVFHPEHYKTDDEK